MGKPRWGTDPDGEKQVADPDGETDGETPQFGDPNSETPIRTNSDNVGYRTMLVSKTMVKVQFHVDDKYDFTEDAKANTTFMGMNVGVEDSVWIALKEAKIAKDFDRKCYWTEKVCCEK